MSSEMVGPAARPAPGPASPGFGMRLTAAAHGLVLCLLSLISVLLLLTVPLAAGGAVHAAYTSTLGFEVGFGLGLVLIPGVSLVLRPLTNLNRRLVERWCGVAIGPPYLPPPRAGRLRRLRWLLTDPATWRDMLWSVVSPCLSWLLPVAAWAAPRLLRGYGTLARSMLGPTGQAELARRTRHLAQTRADAIDAGAAEMRRIERDLHDGAQARLVAMGMTLDAADQLLADNPAARALLAEARESSAKALAELRDLVRGVHPPVLADRGLADALHALALNLPLRVHFASELAGRPPAPVESAAYFAVSELLANVSKHAYAGQAWLDLRHEAGMLRVGVTDDGSGGADPARGSGLAGIERRLAAFDGVLAVSSPPGGPTVMTLEIPCALSSPKTSSC
jgi:signal transduction histidine kinase